MKLRPRLLQSSATAPHASGAMTPAVARPLLLLGDRTPVMTRMSAAPVTGSLVSSKISGRASSTPADIPTSMRHTCVAGPNEPIQPSLGLVCC